MKNRRCGGFTLVEVAVAGGLLAALLVLAFAPLSGSIAQTQREASMLTMDLSAKRSFSRIGSALNHAVLPIATYADHDVPVAKNKVATFQDLINSDLGFGINGGDWEKVLMAGSDFVPFAVPVDFGDDGDTLDGRLALELGIALPDGSGVAAGSYTDRDGRNVLDGGVGSLHPTLARLAPADFGGDVADGDAWIDLSRPRFLARPVFSPEHEAFGLLRFVPAPRSAAEGGGWVTVDEKKLTEKGGGGMWDLNDDGQAVDVYALGHVELTYVGRGGSVVGVPVSGRNVLLQLNRDSPAWKPLFRLVRQAAKDLTPYEGTGETAASDMGGYALFIDLLVFDQSSQNGSPLAFNASLPYLVRRHRTMVELRNMTNANALKIDS